MPSWSEAFNRDVDLHNARHADAIARASSRPCSIRAWSSLKKPRAFSSALCWRNGHLDLRRMYPHYPQRGDEESSLTAEIAAAAAQQALAQAGAPGGGGHGAVRRLEHAPRAYPAMAVEIEQALGAGAMVLT